jgi:hypothetical protein
MPATTASLLQLREKTGAGSVLATIWQIIAEIKPKGER